MRDSTFMKLMGVLPKSSLSLAVGAATRAPAPAAVHQAAMRLFAKRYGVNLEEAEFGIEGYARFSDFFARGLKPGSRPIAPGRNVLVSPVDGVISQIGTTTEDGQLVQAKGIDYSLAQLLGDADAARTYAGGAFTTIYLSPRDYHRIHAPLEGDITGWSYLPGEFWPVNPASVASKRALFAVNERLVTYLSTPAGRCAVVMVGATCVSRIRVTFSDVVTHAGRPGEVCTFSTPPHIAKGGELGRFEMGSTVILLFEKDRVRLDGELFAETAVRMGRRMGEVLP